MAEFKSTYGQLMSASTLAGGPSERQQEALRELDGLMVVAEHALAGAPVGAGAHATICALLMDAYAKGRAHHEERYMPSVGLTHLHGTPEPGWMEHNHLGGGTPHAHDAETNVQVPLKPEDC